MELTNNTFRDARNSKEYDYTPVVVVTSDSVDINLRPSILKGTKNSSTLPEMKKFTPNASPSRQPLIGPENQSNDSERNCQNDPTDFPINQHATNFTATDMSDSSHVVSSSSTSREII